MNHQNKLLLGFVIVLFLSACQWRGMRYRDLMPGIRPTKADYERSIAVESSDTHHSNDVAEGRNALPEAHTSAEQPLQEDSQTGEILLPSPLKDRSEQLLYRTGYVTSYNSSRRNPNWVAWHLTANHTSGSYKRKGVKYTEDTDVPSPRATTWDYSRSGYDRGHMCPAGDNKWSKQAMNDCFLLTNICPQNHQLNNGDWNELEISCRRWAEQFGSIDIVCGPIFFKGNNETIGPNKVAVPDAFFKLVLCKEGAPKAIGFIYRNASGNRPKGDYVNTVDEVERITGIDFFADLPDEIEQQVEQTVHEDDWF